MCALLSLLRRQISDWEALPAGRCPLATCSAPGVPLQLALGLHAPPFMPCSHLALEPAATPCLFLHRCPAAVLSNAALPDPLHPPVLCRASASLALAC